MGEKPRDLEVKGVEAGISPLCLSAYATDCKHPSYKIKGRKCKMKKEKETD